MSASYESTCLFQTIIRNTILMVSTLFNAFFSNSSNSFDKYCSNLMRANSTFFTESKIGFKNRLKNMQRSSIKIMSEAPSTKATSVTMLETTYVVWRWPLLMKINSNVLLVKNLNFLSCIENVFHKWSFED